MASEELKTLIELKRANPYDSTQSIDALRGDGPDGGRIPAVDTNIESVDADGVYCEWVVSRSASSDAVFLFFHGGGYYRSSAVASRRIASDLSAACGCRCFTVDYRLAPEHPFPAAVDDAYAAYHWLLGQGIEANRIVVGGSSAGGGLTAALLARLKLNDEAMPCAAVLLSPWTDLTQSAETFVSNVQSDPSISKEYLDRMAAQYLRGTDPKDPLASPVYSDLEGLPPMLVQAGTSETMYGDALAYVNEARAAGVPVRFEPFEDVIHGWHNSQHVVPNIPEALDAIERIGSFVSERLD